MILAHDQINQQADQITDEDQKRPQHSVHSPPFSILIDPDNNRDPDDEKEKRKGPEWEKGKPGPEVKAVNVDILHAVSHAGKDPQRGKH
jgi:hypothetical protein